MDATEYKLRVLILDKQEHLIPSTQKSRLNLIRTTKETYSLMTIDGKQQLAYHKRVKSNIDKSEATKEQANDSMLMLLTIAQQPDEESDKQKTKKNRAQHKPSAHFDRLLVVRAPEHLVLLKKLHEQDGMMLCLIHSRPECIVGDGVVLACTRCRCTLRPRFIDATRV
jgi:hypothetical protein